MFPDHSPLSRVEIMFTMFRKLDLSPSSGKKQGWNGNTYSVGPSNKDRLCLRGPTAQVFPFPSDSGHVNGTYIITMCV